MKSLRIAIACRNASGLPDLPIFTVTATEEEVKQGVHYDKAVALAEDEDYEGPFICYDEAEQCVILQAACELDVASKLDPGQTQN